jgi:hypothetical protein
LAGVAPCNRTRGTLRGHRTIWGGRRCALPCIWLPGSQSATIRSSTPLMRAGSPQGKRSKSP